MMSNKPFSQACEENKQPILEVLRVEFCHVKSVLEIGSGTGQHAVYFASALAHLQWQTSDLAENIPGIESWRKEASLPNTPSPLCLDVSDTWSIGPYDGVFSANTTHIMSWRQVQCMFARLAEILPQGGVFCLYGPFNYRGQYTSDSNARFDAWLKARDPLSGIRDAEALHALAAEAGLHKHQDYAMPVNNRILVWRR